MGIIAPLMLGFGILIPILILLYLLKVRRREMPVSSTYLWQDLLRDLAAHEPWQRFHWSTLLVFQLVVLSLMVAALARPFWTVQAEEAVHAVLILDGSISMQATDVEPNRFEAARRAAREAVQKLSENSTATVIVARAQPEVVQPSTGDRQALLRAIDRAEAGFGHANALQALSLAASLGGDKGKVRAHLFTDGTFEAIDVDADDVVAKTLAGLEVETVVVGGTAENVAITTLSARPDPRNVRQFQVFARVHNFGDAAARTNLVLNVDGNLTESREVNLEPGGHQDYIFRDLPLGAKTAEAHLAAADAFALDNAAYAVLDARRNVEVLLVTQGNLFLERVLGLMPSTQVFRVAPRRYYAVDADRYDVVVLDGFIPEALPQGGVWIINPPESGLLTIEGEVRRPRVRHWDREDPLLQFVDLKEVAINRAQRIAQPPWTHVLVESDDAPLMLAGEFEGRKVVILPFDVRQSNLPLTAAFPILVSNTLGYLERANQFAARDIRPTDSITLALMPQSDEVHIRRPDGQPRIFPAQGQPMPFDDTRQPGVYHVAQRLAGQTIVEDIFAVNSIDEAESDIRPRTPIFPWVTTAPSGIAALVPLQREMWSWLVPLVLLFLVAEWFWFHRKS